MKYKREVVKKNGVVASEIFYDASRNIRKRIIYGLGRKQKEISYYKPFGQFTTKEVADLKREAQKSGIGGMYYMNGLYNRPYKYARYRKLISKARVSKGEVNCG